MGLVPNVWPDTQHRPLLAHTSITYKPGQKGVYSCRVQTHISARRLPMVTRMQSHIRQNYTRELETAVNCMINMELCASYVYLSMSYYFDRDDVALPHFSSFYKEQSHKERNDAEKLMTFQNQRGGRILLQDIKKPENDTWSNGLEAMQCALQLEKSINQCLLDLHKLGFEQKDPYLCHFLEMDYLREQAEIMKKLGGYISRLERLGAPANGVAEYLFDRHTLAGNS